MFRLPVVVKIEKQVLKKNNVKLNSISREFLVSMIKTQSSLDECLNYLITKNFLHESEAYGNFGKRFD